MNWKGVRVAVTGAGGFIGSHLVEELVARQAKVRAMVRYNSSNSWSRLEELPRETLSRIEVIPADVTDPHAVESFVEGQSVVFHLAASISIPYSYRAPASFVQANAVGTLNVLEASLKGKVRRVVHTSTSEAYGEARYAPMDENHPLQAQSPYAASKIAADKLAESFHRSFGLPVSILRPFNTFGPRQSARAIIPTIMAQLAAGASLLRLGNLRPVRDLTYVRDTARGFIRMAESSAAIGQTINLGTGRGVSVQQLVQKIFSVAKTRATVESVRERSRRSTSEIFKLISDNRKARSVIRWRPEVSLEEGLEETWRYIERNLQRYKPELYNV